MKIEQRKKKTAVPKKQTVEKRGPTAEPATAAGPKAKSSAAPSERPSPEKETPLQRAHREARDFTAATRAAAERAAVAHEVEQEAKPRDNPLLALPEERRARLFVWLRECPYNDAVQQMLRDQGIPGVTTGELTEFFQEEANYHWERRIERAALEANALVSLVEKNPVRFSSGILAALGQEAFRQIASGEVEPNAMTKMATLFLKARGDERAEQALEMKREQQQQSRRDSTERALETFAEEVSAQPNAKKAFEALKTELLRAAEVEA